MPPHYDLAQRVPLSVGGYWGAEHVSSPPRSYDRNQNSHSGLGLGVCDGTNSFHHNSKNLINWRL